MSQLVVYDDTALISLFNDDDKKPFRFWEQAEAGQRIVIFPTLAITAATEHLGATEADWQVFLHVDRVHDVPLTTTAAIGVGHGSGNLVTRHVVYETRIVNGIVLTADPGRYSGARVYFETI